jgi:hypothetical protein
VLNDDYFDSPSSFVLRKTSWKTFFEKIGCEGGLSTIKFSLWQSIAREMQMNQNKGSPSSPVQDELIGTLLFSAVRFQSRARVFRILLMRFLHRR